MKKCPNICQSRLGLDQVLVRLYPLFYLKIDTNYLNLLEIYSKYVATSWHHQNENDVILNVAATSVALYKPAMCENLNPHVTIFYICLQHDKILYSSVLYGKERPITRFFYQLFVK